MKKREQKAGVIRVLVSEFATEEGFTVKAYMSLDNEWAFWGGRLAVAVK